LVSKFFGKLLSVGVLLEDRFDFVVAIGNGSGLISARTTTSHFQLNIKLTPALTSNPASDLELH
jgi:hypothetical protein